MRIVLLVILIFSFTSMVLHAQPIMFGIKGGANLSNAQSAAFSDKFTLGWEVGPYVGFNFFKYAGIQAEALYSWTRLKTLDYSNLQKSGIEAGKKKLNYISIPILLRFNVTESFTINGGPQLNVLTFDDKYKLQNGSAAFKERYTNWVVGFELNIPGPKKATLYARYNWGSGFENIGDGKDANIQRIQIGLFAPIIGRGAF